MFLLFGLNVVFFIFVQIIRDWGGHKDIFFLIKLEVSFFGYYYKTSFFFCYIAYSRAQFPHRLKTNAEFLISFYCFLYFDLACSMQCRSFLFFFFIASGCLFPPRSTSFQSLFENPYCSLSATMIFQLVFVT